MRTAYGVQLQPWHWHIDLSERYVCCPQPSAIVGRRLPCLSATQPSSTHISQPCKLVRSNLQASLLDPVPTRQAAGHTMHESLQLSCSTAPGSGNYGRSKRRSYIRHVAYIVCASRRSPSNVERCLHAQKGRRSLSHFMIRLDHDREDARTTDRRRSENNTEG